MDTDLIIQTERLVLRPFERRDIDAVLSYSALPEVQRYLDGKIRDRTDAKAAFDQMRRQHRLTRPGDAVTLAIVRRTDGMVIGHVSLRWSDATAGQGEVRLAVAPEFRRQRYASEALREVISLGFDKYHLHRIFARIAGGNDASARLLKGIGMRLEAHYREHALFEGEWDEELHFAILDREWQRGVKVREISRHKVA